MCMLLFTKIYLLLLIVHTGQIRIDFYLCANPFSLTSYDNASIQNKGAFKRLFHYKDMVCNLFYLVQSANKILLLLHCTCIIPPIHSMQ